MYNTSKTSYNTLPNGRKLIMQILWERHEIIVGWRGMGVVMGRWEFFALSQFLTKTPNTLRKEK